MAKPKSQTNPPPGLFLRLCINIFLIRLAAHVCSSDTVSKTVVIGGCLANRNVVVRFHTRMVDIGSIPAFEAIPNVNDGGNTESGDDKIFENDP
jgi:hypothetical protein